MQVSGEWNSILVAISPGRIENNNKEDNKGWKYPKLIRGNRMMLLTNKYIGLYGSMHYRPREDSLALLEMLSERHKWLCEGLEELSVTPLPQWQWEITRRYGEH